MCKYISGVPKVVEKEKQEKTPKATSDSKEYERNRTRKFLAKRQVGQPSLGYSMITMGWVNFWASEN